MTPYVALGQEQMRDEAEKHARVSPIFAPLVSPLELFISQVTYEPSNIVIYSEGGFVPT
jgi:hypothetical protein